MVPGLMKNYLARLVVPVPLWYLQATLFILAARRVIPRLVGIPISLGKLSRVPVKGMVVNRLVRYSSRPVPTTPSLARGNLSGSTRGRHRHHL